MVGLRFVRWRRIYRVGKKSLFEQRFSQTKIYQNSLQDSSYPFSLFLLEIHRGGNGKDTKGTAFVDHSFVNCCREDLGSLQPAGLLSHSCTWLGTTQNAPCRHNARYGRVQHVSEISPASGFGSRRGSCLGDRPLLFVPSPGAWQKAEEHLADRSSRLKSNVEKSNISTGLSVVCSCLPQSSFLSPFRVSLFLWLTLFQDGFLF